MYRLVTGGNTEIITISAFMHIITHSLDVFLRKHFVRSFHVLTTVHAIDLFSTRFHSVSISIFPAEIFRSCTYVHSPCLYFDISDKKYRTNPTIRS